MDPLSNDDLREISARTIGHYDRSARSFWEGTRDHDVSQNLDALLEAIPGPGPYKVLDFGCGPGRDLAELSRRGHRATGLEGAAAFCKMARAHSGCEVLHQDFLHLDLPSCAFDGVFANASLFHVPSQELPRILGQLADALRPQGVLFSSNPRGRNQEGWNHDRYGAYHDLHAWRDLLTRAGFGEVRHYYRPAGLPRDQQPWLASVWRKQV